MSKRASSPETPIGRFDRVLAYTALTLAAASIICFFAIIIGTASGMSQAAFGGGVWPFVAALPLFGLPLAFVMIITLLIISFVRKGRAGGTRS
ncbi:multidrug ABC transporter ATPase [Microbacterium esteraromaticum]|nr:multidrug ABC transporter ATPase [Microbacterium esteraromaticum]